MKAPTPIFNGQQKRWQAPDKEWLEHQYITLGKSVYIIHTELECGSTTVLNWLCILGIEIRTPSQRHKLQSKRMLNKSGKPSPEASIATLKRYMHRHKVPCVCAWCGEQGKDKYSTRKHRGPTCSLDLHHKDHNTENGNLNNLIYLCETCHSIETAIWKARKHGKVQVTVKNRTILLDFNIGK